MDVLLVEGAPGGTTTRLLLLLLLLPDNCCIPLACGIISHHAPDAAMHLHCDAIGVELPVPRVHPHILCQAINVHRVVPLQLFQLVQLAQCFVALSRLGVLSLRIDLGKEGLRMVQEGSIRTTAG
jgi:hypothetical protein